MITPLNPYPLRNTNPDDVIADPVARLQERWAEPEGDAQEGEDAELEDADQDAVGDEEPNEGDESQDEDEGEGEEPDADEDEDTFESLNDLLEAGGADPAKLTVRVKVAGEERDISVEEALRGYQRQADYDRHMQEVRAEREAVRNTTEQATKEIQTRVQELDLAINMAAGNAQQELQQLQQEYNAVDWQQLRVDDPEEYAARMADFQRMDNTIKHRAQQTMQQMQQTREKATEHMQQVKAQYYQEQSQRLRALDGWQSEDAVRENLTNVFGYLTQQYGATEDELKEIGDHRIFDMARKAKMWDDLQKAGKDALQPGSDSGDPTPTPKKGKRRVLRPGGVRQSGARPQARRVEKQLRSKLKETNSQDAASALLAHRFKQRQPR